MSNPTDNQSSDADLSTFSDSNGWTDPSLYSTFRIFVLKNTFYLLARSKTGIIIFKYEFGCFHWVQAEYPSTDLSDDNNFNQEMYYSTLQANVVNGQIWVTCRGPNGLLLFQYDPKAGTITNGITTTLFKDDEWNNRPQYMSITTFVITNKTLTQADDDSDPEIDVDELYVVARSSSGVILQKYDSTKGWQPLDNGTTDTLSDWGDGSPLKTLVVSDSLWVFGRGQNGIQSYKYSPNSSPTWSTGAIETTLKNDDQSCASMKFLTTNNLIYMIYRDEVGIKLKSYDGSSTGGWNDLASGPSWSNSMNPGDTDWSNIQNYSTIQLACSPFNSIYVWGKSNSALEMQCYSIATNEWTEQNSGPCYFGADSWDVPEVYSTFRGEQINGQIMMIVRKSIGIVYTIYDMKGNYWFITPTPSYQSTLNPGKREYRQTVDLGEYINSSPNESYIRLLANSVTISGNVIRQTTFNQLSVMIDIECNSLSVSGSYTLDVSGSNDTTLLSYTSYANQANQDNPLKGQTGFQGGSVSIKAKSINLVDGQTSKLSILANGGNGGKGQQGFHGSIGGKGNDGIGATIAGPDDGKRYCTPPTNGHKGGKGLKGGDAGDGGNSGNILILIGTATQNPIDTYFDGQVVAGLEGNKGDGGLGGLGGNPGRPCADQFENATHVYSAQPGDLGDPGDPGGDGAQAKAGNKSFSYVNLSDLYTTFTSTEDDLHRAINSVTINCTDLGSDEANWIKEVATAKGYQSVLARIGQITVERSKPIHGRILSPQGALTQEQQEQILGYLQNPDSLKGVFPEAYEGYQRAYNKRQTLIMQFQQQTGQDISSINYSRPPFFVPEAGKYNVRRLSSYDKLAGGFVVSNFIADTLLTDFSCGEGAIFLSEAAIADLTVLAGLATPALVITGVVLAVCYFWGTNIDYSFGYATTQAYTNSVNTYQSTISTWNQQSQQFADAQTKQAQLDKSNEGNYKLDRVRVSNRKDRDSIERNRKPIGDIPPIPSTQSRTQYIGMVIKAERIEDTITEGISRLLADTGYQMVFLEVYIDPESIVSLEGVGEFLTQIIFHRVIALKMPLENGEVCEEGSWYRITTSQEVSLGEPLTAFDFYFGPTPKIYLLKILQDLIYLSQSTGLYAAPLEQYYGILRYVNIGKRILSQTMESRRRLATIPEGNPIKIVRVKNVGMGSTHFLYDNSTTPALAVIYDVGESIYDTQKIPSAATEIISEMNKNLSAITILSHWDLDHYLIGTYAGFHKGRIWIAPYLKTSRIASLFCDAINEQGGSIYFPTAKTSTPQTVSDALGEAASFAEMAAIPFSWPTNIDLRLTSEVMRTISTNNTGALTMGVLGDDFKMLIPGDASYRYIDPELMQGLTHLEASHHGSIYSFTKSTLNIPQATPTPGNLYYSYGLNNNYNISAERVQSYYSSKGWTEVNNTSVTNADIDIIFSPPSSTLDLIMAPASNEDYADHQISEVDKFIKNKITKFENDSSLAKTIYKSISEFSTKFDNELAFAEKKPIWKGKIKGFSGLLNDYKFKANDEAKHIVHLIDDIYDKFKQQIQKEKHLFDQFQNKSQQIQKLNKTLNDLLIHENLEKLREKEEQNSIYKIHNK